MPIGSRSQEHLCTTAVLARSLTLTHVSTASCLAVPRPRKVTHLKPQSMQNITLLLPPTPQKSALLFSPLPLMSTSSQSFDCMSQLKHLMLYLKSS